MKTSIYGGLKLVVSGGIGCGIVINFGGSFLHLMFLKIYWGGQMVVIFVIEGLSLSKHYPEN